MSSNENETSPPTKEPLTNTTPNNVVSLSDWKSGKYDHVGSEAPNYTPWVPPTERAPDPKPPKKPGSGTKKKAAAANSSADFFAQSVQNSAYIINAYGDLIYLLTAAMHEIEQTATDPKIIKIAAATNATTAKILKQVTIDLGLS